MPLYEYECDACGHRFERIQKFADAPVERCPKCDGDVRKLLSSPAIQFKGSGWYITDYAKKAGGSDGAKPVDGDKSDKKDKKTEKSEKSESAAEKPAAKPASDSAKAD
jgi:putative FmdB family regulatory protein